MFTDVEMAILSQLSYCNYPPPPKNLHDFLEGKATYLREKLGNNFTEAINTLIAKTEKYPYMIVDAEDDPDTGFAAFAVSGPDNQVTTVCRGTQLDQTNDIGADLMLALVKETKQQEKMKKFVSSLEKTGYSGYSFAGHSLGGNLAMYGTIILSDPDKLIHTASFNAPGMNVGVWSEHKETIKKVSGRMTTYQNEMDAVSDCFRSPGEIIVVENTGLDINLDGVTSHGMSALQVSKDNNSFDRNATGLKYPTAVGTLAHITTTTTDIDMALLSPIAGAANYVTDRTSKMLGTTIKVPLSTLQEHARTMQELTDTNADVFDRVYNSLLCLKENGQWQGTALEAIITATEQNKSKFADTISEMKTLADFLNNFTSDIAEKDIQIKKQINAV